MDPESQTFRHVEESLLLIGDWYHRTAGEVQGSYVNHDSWGREVSFIEERFDFPQKAHMRHSLFPIPFW